MSQNLRTWVHEMGHRHGFGSDGAPQVPDAASSDPESDYSQLLEEGRELHARASELVTELQTAVERAEYVDFLNRTNTFYGRLVDPANEGDAAEMRRVITDLRELIADVEARHREADGDTDAMIGELAEGRIEGADRPHERPADLDTASSDESSSYDELVEEGREVFGRIRRTLEPMTGALSENERRQWVARLNTFSGRVNSPPGNSQEMRRVLTDLYAALQDLERRARELERDPDSARAGADGPEVADPAATASSDPDADFDSLVREAREIHEQAAALYPQLVEAVDEREHVDLRDRLNSFNGRVNALANEHDAAEMRRVITDLRAVVDDWQSRLRELSRNAT